MTRRIHEMQGIVILKLRHMTALDATGLRALEDTAEEIRKSGRHVIVCGAQPQPASLIAQSEFEAHVGAGNVCLNTTVALRRAEALHHATAA